jgi:HlyD family secretion protein
MRRHRWLFDPLGAVQNRYRNTLNQLEKDLESKSISLPSAAPWTRRLTYVILIGIAAGAGWSVLARVDVVVNATGKLEPISQSQIIQSRVGGIVTTISVREGEQVKQGQLLMQLDKTALHNKLQELLMQRAQFVKEIAVLRMAREGKPLNPGSQNKVEIPRELMNQVQNRLLLVAEITGDPSALNAEQRRRYDLFQQQLNARQSITTLESSGLQTQVAETESQLAHTAFQLKTEQELLTKLQPLLDQGAISRTDFLRRSVDVNALQTQLNQTQLQKRKLELSRLQSQVEGNRLVTETHQDLQHQLATLDAEFDTTIKNNQRQLIQVTSQLNQVQLDLKNQDLRAPVDGVVAQLGPKLPGIVAQPGQTLLQVVPNESLIARVQVANSDIANVRVGTPVNIRVDAYPFTEFGAVPGVISKVSNEAMTINEENARQTIFPVEVRLDKQFLQRKAMRFPLSPGMTLAAIIRVRQRAPISYVAEELIKAIDGIQSVR